MPSDIVGTPAQGSASTAGDAWLGRPRPRLKPVGARYTRFVSMMKVVLPAIAGVLVSLVVIWPQLQEDPDEFGVGLSRVTIEDVGGQKIINARYNGIDDKDQPYTLTAEAITKGMGENDLVDLRNPKADLSLQDGAWIALAAPEGRFNQEKQVLRLMGGVSLFHDDGYEFETESATLNFTGGRVYGDRPVTGHGPLGELQSTGFRITGSGSRVLFTGKARLVIYPDKKEAR